LPALLSCGERGGGRAGRLSGTAVWV
jgi:hypothetical protein